MIGRDLPADRRPQRRESASAHSACLERIGKILGDFVTIARIVTASIESLCASGASTRRQIRNIAIIKTGFGDLPVRISAVLSLIPLNQAPAFKRVQSPREISLRQLLAAAPPAHVFHRP